MKQKMLYIHGFNGNPNGGTFQAIKDFFTDYDVLSFPFPKLHTDLEETQKVISDYCTKYEINTFIGASLGAFYVLHNQNDIKTRIVINPCIYPSREIIRLKDRITGLPIKIEDSVLNAWKNLETYCNISSDFAKNTFGIFSKDDELFHYKDTFDKLFGYNNIQNSILIDGHHSIEKEYLLIGLKAAQNYISQQN